MNNKYKNSRELLKRAKKITPLGAQTFSKSYRYFCEGNSPSFMEKGKGAHVWDVDENKYIDFICGLGPVTLGYNDQRINEAITKQMEKGIIFSQPAPISIELSEKLIEIIPCAEMVRFVKNGSDATSAAVRLARAYTERDIIATCGYHGMQDWYIGSTVNNKGVPQKVCELSQSFDYNNIESLESLFAKYPNKIAAVILEPIQSNGPEEGYLQKVKEIAQDNGAVLIFDEVVSGFRYALGGASELYSVTPDLVTLGKGMANGMPISAVAGKKELLNLISDGVFISTTFGGEALSIAAALETINILQEKNGKGIRILNQDEWETLVSFILSANNRIPMIKKSIGLLSEHFGEFIEEYRGVRYYSFPRADVLKGLTVEDLSECKTGFRAKYIISAAEIVGNKEIDIYALKNVSTDLARKELMRFRGIGPKVSDCIMLFSMGKQDAFPIDVWVKRVMEHFYLDEDTNLKDIQKYASEKFGDLAGFAQQYLFYYARELGIGKKSK